MARKDRVGTGVTSITSNLLSIKKEGEAFNGVCEKCKLFSEGTYQIRDYTLQSALTAPIIVKTLVGVCSGCDEIIVVPHQYLEDIKETLINLSKKT